MRNAGTKALFSHWNSLRGARTAPSRADLDPVAIPHLLPDLMILERLADEGLQFRLAGTRLCMLMGREMRGVPFATLMDAESAMELQLYAGTVATEAAAVVLGVACFTDHGRRETAELLLLPLNDAEPTQLLAIMTFSTLPAWYPVHGIVRMQVLSARVMWPSGRPAMDPASRQSPAEEPPPLFTGLHPGARRVGRFLVIDGAGAPR